MHKCMICLIRPVQLLEGYTTVISKPFLWFFTRKKERREVIRMCGMPACQSIGKALVTWNHMLPENEVIKTDDRDSIEKALRHIYNVELNRIRRIKYASLEEQPQEAWAQGMETDTEHSFVYKPNGEQEDKTW